MPDTVRVYHGTNSLLEPWLNKGIRVFPMIYPLDFGPGFYVTPQEDYAKDTADARCDLLRGEDLPLALLAFMGLTPGEYDRVATEAKPQPRVLVFDLHLPELRTLSHRCFDREGEAAWLEFVLDNCVNGKPHTFDWVFGPISKRPDVDVFLPSPGDQFCLHSPTAIRILERGRVA